MFVLAAAEAGSVLLALYCWGGKGEKAKQRIHVLGTEQGLVRLELAAREIHLCLGSTAAELAVFLVGALPPSFVVVSVRFTKA